MTKLEKTFSEYKFTTWRDTEFTIDMIECNKGWHDIIAELINELISLGWNKKICQIKEKYGGLRFYLDEGDEKMMETIDKYERKSHTVCELCGSAGSTNKVKGWWKTLCEECQREK